MIEAMLMTRSGKLWEGGYYTGEMFDDAGNVYALVTAPKSGGEQKATDYLAATTFCNELSLNGKADWVVPTLVEQLVQYAAFKPTVDLNVTSNGASNLIIPPTANFTESNPPQTTVEDFLQSGAESFSAGPFDAYWSTTESSDGTYQMCLQFDDSNATVRTPESPVNASYLYVRAIRRVYL